MTKLFNKKTIFALILAAVSLMLCCIPAYAEPFEREQLYFDYSDGVVRDGARNDRPGIIGDELDRDERDTRSPNRDDENTVDNMASRARGADDSEEDMTTFWGIVIAMVVAAAVILLIALVVPKNREQDRNR